MDLPKIEAGEGEAVMNYTSRPFTKYQEWARKNSDMVYNHIAMRHTPRLVERFAQIKFGQSVADVSQEFQQRKRGNAKIISGKTYSQNNMRPFPNKPSPTIPASFQSNFIHPHFNRNYTAREGARLQSFPDDYLFLGPYSKTYMQIGNAVPPLMSNDIAKVIKSYLDEYYKN